MRNVVKAIKGSVLCYLGVKITNMRVGLTCLGISR